MEVDPIRYEMFLHRLWAVGEEGRSTLQRVTASPIVAQGGEVMSSFYDANGTMVLACSGHLRFAAATSDAIKQMIEWFETSPGFHDGDQLFFNDPYVAGSHTYDMMVVKPVFLDGRLIAWIATSTHTADTGGVLRGGALEIFHEGIRILGVKVVERGEFREDVFRTLTEQCRDPQYVGLDIKAMIAGNNVCAARYLGLVDKFSLEFIEAAGQKTLADAEEMARAKLRILPDGVWRSRVYYSAREADQSDADIIAVVCAVTKKGDALDIDLDGTSPQTSGDTNSTLPSTVAHLNIALTNQLFWDIPWNDGKLAPIRMTVPKGSVLNCTFPAACGLAPLIGGMFVSAVSECLAKMLYAAGRKDDVNAGWTGSWYSGGPGFMYGGHNREGLANAQGLYDVHGGGLGARPNRDGVDTGGHMNIPSGGISDIERIEMQYPFIYLSRRHVKDGAGFGKYRGGYGSERLLFVYGSTDVTANYRPYGAVPNGFGLFGGYPVGFGGNRALYRTESLLQKLREGAYPTGADELESLDWCRIELPDGFQPRIPIPELAFITDVTQSGGGFGDPLERSPIGVAQDISTGRTSTEVADRIYGVRLNGTGSVDDKATADRRKELREERLGNGSKSTDNAGDSDFTKLASETGPDTVVVLHVHEYLDLVRTSDRLVMQCRKCAHVFCGGEGNYKNAAIEITVDPEELAGEGVPSGDPYRSVLLGYVCPGCATLLQIDVFCPTRDDQRPLWDIQLDCSQLA